ncbi:hypothetical protein H5T87_02130 [bacterium]|nr:hypothetical protein [bacterium]
MDIFPIFLILVLFLSIPAYSKINDIYVITFTHLDIGFNWPKNEVGIGYKHCIDHAIELCKQFPDFKWTIETSWQLGEWLKRTNDKKKLDELKKLILEGRIYLAAAPATFHSGVLSSEEACRLFYPTYKICRKLGIDMPAVAIQNDVPGYTIAYPLIMKESGIKYFLTGINSFIGKGADIPLKDIPFWWEGDGGAKVLTWISPSYIEAMDWGLSHFDAGKLTEQDEKMKKKLEELENLGYRHNAVIVLASILDNLDSTGAAGVLTCIRHWNSQGKKPRIILSNPQEFFSHIEKSIKTETLPRYRGDWSGLWEVVRASLGYGNILSRWAKEYLPVAETLSSIFKMKYRLPYPGEDLEKGWNAIWQYDEHTAGGGVAQDYGATREQVKQGEWESLFVAEEAYASASNILDFALRIMPVSNEKPIIFNPLPWEREEILWFNLPQQFKGNQLIFMDDKTGEQIPSEMVDESTFLLKLKLPSFGYKFLKIEKKEGTSKPKRSEDLTIENEFYKVYVNPDGIISSIYDKTANRELLNLNGDYRFNELLKGKTSETYIGAVRKAISGGEKCRIKCEKGELMERIIVEREDCPLAKTEIRLYKGIKRIEIADTLDLKSGRFSNGDSFLLSFPFNIDREKMVLRVDGPLHARLVPDDYLPPQTISTLPANRWIELREGDSYGVVISSRQAYLWLAGKPRWAEHQLDRDPVLFSILLNAPEVEEEPPSFMRSPYPMPDRFQFEYAITTNDSFDPVGQEKFASEFCLPSLYNTRPLPGYQALRAEAEESFISVEPENVRLLTIKRAEYGEENEFVIRLLEKAGKQTIATIGIPAKVKEAALCDLLEREKGDKPLSLEPLRVRIEPYGVVTLKIKIAD